MNEKVELLKKKVREYYQVFENDADRSEVNDVLAIIDNIEW